MNEVENVNINPYIFIYIYVQQVLIATVNATIGLNVTFRYRIIELLRLQ